MDFYGVFIQDSIIEFNDDIHPSSAAENEDVDTNIPNLLIEFTTMSNAHRSASPPILSLRAPF